MTHRPVRTLAVVAAGIVLPGGVGHAQDPGPTGIEAGGVPAVSFDSDEGFGYGAIVEVYQYGDGGLDPYVWTLQPTLFLTTEGRRDLTLFIDAPHLLPDSWRLTAFAGRQKQIATPYYGVGNAASFDESLATDDGPNPFYYRFGLTRSRLTFDLQRGLGPWPLRLLAGGGFERVSIDPIPEDEGTTLYALDFGTEEQERWLNHLRLGLIWDTRDRETGPTSGTWTELLVRASDESLGADVSFLRWTFTDRRYFTLARDVVFAHRYLIQHVTPGAPVHELFQIQTSFKRQEGLGGSDSVRGVLRNRYVGRGMLVWNSELRWRALDFRAVGRPFHLVLSAFLDQGRVWGDGVQPDALLEDLHRGYGGGVRIGMGENFVVASDAGTTGGGGLGVYVGLGYLY